MVVKIDNSNKVIYTNNIISKEEFDEMTDTNIYWDDRSEIPFPNKQESMLVIPYYYQNTKLFEFKTIKKEKMVTIEDVRGDVSQVKSITSNTDSTVTLSADDVLTLMEIQIENQVMLSKILTHLGLK
ncbi:MAG: hypothetical protein ACRC1P_11005 [Cellulosilyticaceae bacterium]